MLQASSEFGLTPSSRSRIVAGNGKAKETEDDMKKAVKKQDMVARKDIQENAPEDRCLCKSWAAKTTKETANAMRSWCIPETGTSWPICWSSAMR